MSGKITLLEALEPDVLRLLHENQESLQQLLRAAPKPYVQTVVESGGQAGKSVTENIDFSNISIPIQYSDLLEILISGRVDGISPYFKRMEMTVPAGMTMSMMLQIPN